MVDTTTEHEDTTLEPGAEEHHKLRLADKAVLWVTTGSKHGPPSPASKSGRRSLIRVLGVRAGRDKWRFKFWAAAAARPSRCPRIDTQVVLEAALLDGVGALVRGHQGAPAAAQARVQLRSCSDGSKVATTLRTWWTCGKTPNWPSRLSRLRWFICR